jgi:hypothetical protein
MTLHELPFLNPTEFVRAKLRKCGRCEGDVDDIAWMVRLGHLGGLHQHRRRFG